MTTSVNRIGIMQQYDNFIEIHVELQIYSNWTWNLWERGFPKSGPRFPSNPGLFLVMDYSNVIT